MVGSWKERLAALLLLFVGVLPAQAQFLPNAVGRATALSSGASRAKLPYVALVMIDGDSQARGTPTTAEIAAFKASYVVTDQVKVLNNTGQWVTYDPANNLAGVDAYAGNSGNPGMEAGFISRFIATYSTPLYIAKRGAPGSYQTRGLPEVPTVTASISGNIANVTAGTALANYMFTGTGVPLGTYFLFAQTAPNFYVGKLGQSAGVSYTVSSTTMTLYNALKSWSVTEGALYLGASNSITNQTRGIYATAIATVPNSRVVAWFDVLGTNDMADTTLGGNFQTDFQAAIDRRATDFDLSNAQICVPRVGTGGLSSTTVRAAQAAVVALASASRKLINMDAQNRHDGTHWDLAGLTYAGNACYDAIAF